MKFSLLSAFGFLALAACTSEPASNETAADFAARINGGSASSATFADQKTAAIPKEAHAPPQIDPATSTCGAPQAASAIGQADSDQLRAEIGKSVPAGGILRILKPGKPIGSVYHRNRLNVMLDSNGIIRDLLCG